MAIELARTALWLEGFEEGRPLGFLDHHLQVGDALLGLTDLKALELGIAKDAFKPLSGDDKEVCKQLAKTNAAALKDLEKEAQRPCLWPARCGERHRQWPEPIASARSPAGKQHKRLPPRKPSYHAFLEQAKTSRLAHAADLLVGAYLLPKRRITSMLFPPPPRSTSPCWVIHLPNTATRRTGRCPGRLRGGPRASLAIGFSASVCQRWI
jgi:hypothetical protein